MLEFEIQEVEEIFFSALFLSPKLVEKWVEIYLTGCVWAEHGTYFEPYKMFWK